MNSRHQRNPHQRNDNAEGKDSGTSGWSYEQWKGVFYPEKISTKQLYETYVGHFLSAEVNSSFYRMPSLKTLALWLESTLEDFIFSVKASRYVTHMKKLKAPEVHVSVLLDRIRVLGDRLGPILFQLPPRWHCNQERFAVFQERLLSGFRYAFEFRHPSWQFTPSLLTSPSLLQTPLLQLNLNEILS